MKRYWSQLSFGVSTTSFRDRGAEYGLVTFRAIVQQTDPDRPQTSIGGNVARVTPLSSSNFEQSDAPHFVIINFHYYKQFRHNRSHCSI